MDPRLRLNEPLEGVEFAQFASGSAAGASSAALFSTTGAATRREEDRYVTVPDPAADRSSLESTDSIVGENADELDAAEPGATDVAAPAVENKAADEAPAAEPEAN